MRVAILSDIHDNLWTLRAALHWLHDTDAMIFCGDFCSPFTLERIASAFAKPIHCVFGNNDGDRFRMTTTAARFPHVTLWGEFADIGPEQLAGRRVAVTHYPEIARAIAASGIYDMVCFGHSHRIEQSTVGGTLLVNPGELMGGLTGEATFVVYDTVTQHLEPYEVTYVPFAGSVPDDASAAAPATPSASDNGVGERPPVPEAPAPASVLASRWGGDR